MGVSLVIHDGDPWYLSPDVWVVPGDDPHASPGQPVAGGKAHLWARVRNDGDVEAPDAFVRYYWANPAVGVTRSTANFLASARVTLEPSQQSDVLCPVPWHVQYLNGGHLCVLAEAFHPALDPLPRQDEFDVAEDRHVAQRNLQVLQTTAKAPTVFGFEVHNPRRTMQDFTLRAEEANPSGLEALAETSGLEPELLKQGGRAEVIGFTGTGCPTPEDLNQALPVLEDVRVAGHGITGFYMAALLEGSVALVNVTQFLDGQSVGGLSCLLVRNQQ